MKKKSENYYRNILGARLWKLLSYNTKKTFIEQINYLENDILAQKDIKIRVRPWMINFVKKITGVNDFKWWAWWWNTIYLWHASDLFNPQIVQHEWIHILQQQELWWFIPWLIEDLKECIFFKKENKITNPNIMYDFASKIPTEAEAYWNQAVKWYLNNREKKWFLKKGQQVKYFQRIIQANYEFDIKRLKNLRKIALSENDKIKLAELDNDLKFLESTKYDKVNFDTSILRIYNHLDKIEDITRVIKVLQQKLNLLETGINNIRMVKKLDKMIKLTEREAKNENVSYMLDSEYSDKKTIKQTIVELTQKCHEYRSMPTFIYIEDSRNINNQPWIEERSKTPKKRKKLAVTIPCIYPDVIYHTSNQQP